MASSPKIYVLQLYGNMRVVVEYRKNQWEVWPQRISEEHEWRDHDGPAAFEHKQRLMAIVFALRYFERIIRNLERDEALDNFFGKLPKAEARE